MDSRKLEGTAILIESLKLGGGAERVASLLSCTLDIPVITWYRKEKEYPPKDTISLNVLPGFAPWVGIRRIAKLSKLLKNNDIRVIIAFMEPSIIPATLTKIVFRRELRLISSVRTNILEEKAYSQWLKKTSFQLYKYSDMIITPSKGLSNLVAQLSEKVVHTIENPVDTNTIKKLSFNSSPHQMFDFITVGRLTRAKGHWFLIRSFKDVVEHYPNATLAIIGDGELRGKLEELIKLLKIEDNVFLLGRQENPFKYVAKAKTFVFTSLWEGFPNTLLEALALNKLVISTDCDFGPREILAPELKVDEKINYPYYGSYGILTKPFPDVEIWDDRPLIEEEKMLAELMLKTLEEPKLRRKYSPRGLKRAQKNTPEKITKKWKRIIGECII